MRGGNREGLVLQPELSQVIPRRRVEGPLNCDSPGVSIGRAAQGIDGTGSPVQERSGDLVLAQQLDSAFNGISLADGSHIQLHPFPVELYRKGPRIEMHMVHSHQLSGLRNGFCCRQTAGGSHEPPAAHKRGDGRIERPASRLAPGFRLHEKLEEARLDSDSPERRPAIQIGDVAGGAVKTELRLQTGDLFEDRFSNGLKVGLPFAVDQQFELGCHRKV